MFEKQSHPIYASARLWDDGIVDPRILAGFGSLVTNSLNAPIKDGGIFRM